jgi:ABC-type transport system involved in Fe-S cluster assembly fused permease/ATPase subunit
MDDGRIVEDGTHTALVAAGGRHAGPWSRWRHARVVATAD